MSKTALFSDRTDSTSACAPGETAHRHGNRLWFDLALLGTAIIWGSAFAAQRVAAAYVGPFLYNGFRFLMGALVLLPIVLARETRPTRLEWRGGILAGLILTGAAVLQQAGLKFTTAGKAAFITGLYVVLVPLLLALLWRELPRKLAWIGSALAVAGLYLLSGQGGLALAPGDGLELAGAFLWASHVILIDRLARQVDVWRLSEIQYVVCGLACTALGLTLEMDTLPGLRVAWWTVLYGGVVSVGIGYTLQAIGQRGAPATDAVLMMSLEGVFAAFFGWWFFGELLTPRQLVGCGLMLGGMLLVQLAPRKEDRRRSSSYVEEPV